MKLITIEICNQCDGLVGWDKWREGCCWGGMRCLRQKGVRILTIPIDQTKIIFSNADPETLDVLIRETEALFAVTRFARVKKLLDWLKTLKEGVISV